MSEHFDGCWQMHPACAIQRVRELERKVAQLENGIVEPTWLARLRDDPIPCCDTVSGPILTHGVVLKLHGQGPTWAHAQEDPPTR